VATPAAPTFLSLEEARRLALEKQPALAAYRASLAAAEAKANALENLRLAALVRRDLPTRRLQASQGVIATNAQLRKAEQATIYATTRTWLSVVYARQQLALADKALDESPDTVTSLSYLRKVAGNIYKDSTRRDVKKWDVDQIDVLIRISRARREQAKEGVERALAALREAVGLERDCPLDVPANAKLPGLTLKLTKDEVISLALERRGEIVQSAVGVEVTSLEIDAQKMIFGPRGDTFASGSDLHAEAVPQGIANGEYRPGAITVEMPGQFVGHKSARVEQAQALQSRAVAVADKTRHLITLEAVDAYLKWTESSRKAEEYQKAATLGEKAADEAREAFNPNDKMGGKPTLQEIVELRVRATQITLRANQARFEALLALAALERITAGGVCPGFGLQEKP
jgi:outer membrane protein TolC